MLIFDSSCHNSASSQPIPLQGMQKAPLLSNELLAVASAVTLAIKGCGFPMRKALLGGAIAGASFIAFSICKLSPFVQAKVRACACALRAMYIHIICMSYIYLSADLKKHTWLLPFAAKAGHVKTVQALLKAGADFEARDKNGQTALMVAVHGQVATMQALIDARANIEAQDFNGFTTLMWAAIQGNLSAIETLHHAGADLEASHQNGTALMLAAFFGQTASFRALRQAGAKLETRDKGGMTALLWAASGGYVEMVKELLANKANLEARDDGKLTALMHAALNGTVDALNTLIHAGAKIDDYDDLSETALFKAAKNSEFSSMETLCLMGAGKGFCSADGYTAFTYALTRATAQKNAPEIISKLEQLDQGSGNLKYSRILLSRHWLAGVWGLKGSSTLDGIRSSLEGNDPYDVAYKLSTYIAQFFASRHLDARISKEHQQEICAAFANAPPLTSDSDLELLHKIHQGKPVLILGGFRRHGIGIVLCKDHHARYQLMLCNRGAGRRKYTTEISLIPRENLNKTCIKNLRSKVYQNATEFYQMISNLHGTPFGGVNQKPQGAGNCCVANGKGAFRSLLNWFTNESVGYNIYKEFTNDFMREKALQEHLDEITELDIDMLEQLERKYVNEKHKIVLSDQVLNQLYAALKKERP